MAFNSRVEMASRKRRKNFTIEERTHLLDLITTEKEKILSDKNDTSALSAKHNAWMKTTTEFNSISSTSRDKESLMSLFNTMKVQAKKKFREWKMGRTQTGNVTEFQDLDQETLRIHALMPQALERPSFAHDDGNR